MTILCLTGWQQSTNMLSAIAPDAIHFDYSAYADVKSMFTALPREPRLAIGWSLGGQLLVRAIVGGHIKPSALLLLGAPFQWVANECFTEGVPASLVDEIKKDYQDNPKAMLRNLNALVALGDTHEKPIARALNASLNIWPNGMIWLNELASTSCAQLDFFAFPPTTIIHGREDKVIRFANANAFAARLPQVELLLWQGCAHAPHLHDAQALENIVKRYV